MALEPFFVSARTNKRHHHHKTCLVVQGRERASLYMDVSRASLYKDVNFVTSHPLSSQNLSLLPVSSSAESCPFA